MSKESGFVYFVSAYHMSQCGYFKVGITRSDDYKKRIQHIQSNSPFLILPVCVVKHSMPERLESMVLNKFKAHRIRGEWFAIAGCKKTHSFDEFERDVKRFIVSKCDGAVVL